MTKDEAHRRSLDPDSAGRWTSYEAINHDSTGAGGDQRQKRRRVRTEPRGTGIEWKGRGITQKRSEAAHPRRRQFCPGGKLSQQEEFCRW